MLVPPCGEASPCDFPCLLPGPSEAYEALERSSCQCMAATNARVANAVDLERHWANVLIDCDEGAVEESLCLTRSLLKLQAADLRNAAAASAVTAYYLLAGVEAQQDTLDRGIHEVRATLERIDALRREGLLIGEQLDRPAVAARLADLEDERLQLCLLRIQLNGQLKRLLGCPLDESRFFWPVVDWAPNLEPVDIEGAVAEGLARRSDVRSVRLVRCKLSTATTPVARQVLQVADATLGAVTPNTGLIHRLRCGACWEHEIPVRCRQLGLIEQDTRQLAIAKIKSASYKVAVQQDRLRLAKQAVEERRNELLSVEKRRDTDDLTVFEISAARGRVFEAESSLIEKVVELKVAEVALREVQHMLAVECGYAVTICGEHCCTGECIGGCGCQPCGSALCSEPCGCSDTCVDSCECSAACGLGVCGEACAE